MDRTAIPTVMKSRGSWAWSDMWANIAGVAQTGDGEGGLVHAVCPCRHSPGDMLDCRRQGPHLFTHPDSTNEAL